MEVRELTTTSYGVLCLLAVHPWTPYELAQQMQRSIDAFLPKAESVVYEEPKRLVAMGLATAQREHVGRRPRTMYSITPEGREALRAWLDRPGAGPNLQFEAMLQVAFGDQGTKRQLLRTIGDIRRDAEERLEVIEERVREYQETGGPFPERLHVISLIVGFLNEHTRALERWAAWAEAEVTSWPAARGRRVPDGREVLASALRRTSADAKEPQDD